MTSGIQKQKCIKKRKKGRIKKIMERTAKIKLKKKKTSTFADFITTTEVKIAL